MNYGIKNCEWTGVDWDCNYIMVWTWKCGI